MNLSELYEELQNDPELYKEFKKNPELILAEKGITVSPADLEKIKARFKLDKSNDEELDDRINK